MKETPEKCFIDIKQINSVCLITLFWLRSIQFSWNQLLACLYTCKASSSADQLTSDIMNVNERDIIMLSGYLGGSLKTSDWLKILDVAICDITCVNFIEEKITMS